MVEKVVTTTTVKITSLSRAPSRLGRTEAMASAADAPQMPTAPPVSSPNRAGKRRDLARNTPTPMVVATPRIARRIGAGPSIIASDTVMRTPSNATPNRRTVREVKSMPGLQAPSTDRKLKAMPRSRAKSMTGPP